MRKVVLPYDDRSRLPLAAHGIFCQHFVNLLIRCLHILGTAQDRNRMLMTKNTVSVAVSF